MRKSAFVELPPIAALQHFTPASHQRRTMQSVANQQFKQPKGME